MIPTTTEDSAIVEIDAGVILSDRASYLCLPLSRFGLTDDEEIESIISSCECVKPSLVNYADSATTTIDGVLFDFIPEETPLDEPPHLMQVGVVITFVTLGGEMLTARLNLSHTHIPSDKRP